MASLPRAPLLLLFGLVLASGCFANETTITAIGSSPLVAKGFAYDGNVTSAPGEVSISAVDESNTGRVLATWQDEGAWSANWDNFSEAPDKPYQDGGVIFGLDAHGNTTKGDANLPLVHYVAAAWGKGAVQKDGADFVDPLTGGTTFNLHFMVLEDGIRDPATHRVTKSDGVRTYDPKEPADGKTFPGKREILLLVQSPVAGAPARNETAGNVSGMVNAPTYSQQFKFNVPEGASKFFITVNLTSSEPWVGQLDFQLRDAEGKIVGSGRLGGLNQSPSTIVNAPRPKPGEYTLSVSGGGSSLSYAGQATLAFPARTAWVRLLTYETAEWTVSGPGT